jgi:RimJ/RimL family protein N-acetyltransferase
VLESSVWPDAHWSLPTAGAVRLRTPSISDEADITQACRDPLISRWTTVPTPYLPEHAADFVRRQVPSALTDGNAVILSIVDAADALQGMCALHDVDAYGRAGIGFWVAPWARGAGVATAAVRALTSWAITELGLNQVCWTALVGNLDSLRVAHSCGFRGEGTLSGAMMHRGEVVDCWTASVQPGQPLTGPFERAAIDVEIAAGAWQLQPLSMPEAELAERVLPISVTSTQAIWVAKEITTARPEAVVALLPGTDSRGWVIEAPVRAGDGRAAATGRAAIVRYARRALGMVVE